MVAKEAYWNKVLSRNALQIVSTNISGSANILTVQQLSS